MALPPACTKLAARFPQNSCHADEADFGNPLAMFGSVAADASAKLCGCSRQTCLPKNLDNGGSGSNNLKIQQQQATSIIPVPFDPCRSFSFDHHRLIVQSVYYRSNYHLSTITMKLLSMHQAKFWVPVTVGCLLLLALQQHVRQQQKEEASTFLQGESIRASGFVNVLVEVSLEEEKRSLLRTELVPVVMDNSANAVSKEA